MRSSRWVGLVWSTVLVSTTVACGGDEETATTTSSTTTTVATTTTTSAEQAAAVQDLIDGGFEPAVAECVIEDLNAGSLTAEDLAAPDDATNSLIAATIASCEEANRVLEPDEMRQILVDTLIQSAGLTPEQAECSVAAVEAQGATAAELVDQPEQLGALLAQVLPQCLDG